ncbi:tetratricopeptide repeat protein [Fulvivirga sediminis]|uniref:Tetratricopeptide repeat protein n=1 Tax=Fulvivirga sediminis TaxID=2803949 RepID=A0A937K2B1_9BACT|nr:tetratricopeptide repeat protein [Fulvivirga sediminis]MBL3657612.1 tetratricopeptide repeat protein [Fulvivirga sediminis]
MSLSLLDLATCNSKLNKQEETNAYFNDAINAQNKMDQPTDEVLCKIYGGLANMAFDQKNYSKAIFNYRKALSLEKVSDDQKYALYINMANVLNLKGDFDESVEWLKKAKELEKIADVDNDHLLIRLNIEGEHYLLQNQYSKAIELLNQAINVANKEVYNDYFINTLDLMSTSQRAVVNKNGKIEINDIFRLEDLRRQQEKLKSQIIDQLNYKSLQVLLDTEIQNYHKEVKQSEIERERSTIIKIASSCIAIFFFTLLGITVYIKSKNAAYACKIRRVNDLLNE